MAYNQAAREAADRYHKKLKNIGIRVKPEDYDRYRAAADAAGVSLRHYILEAVEERIVKEKTPEGV